MNIHLVKSVPGGDFEDISIHSPNWEACFVSLIKKGKLIKYETYTMPILPESVKDELRKNGYYAQIVTDNHDQFFLIPKTLPT